MITITGNLFKIGGEPQITKVSNLLFEGNHIHVLKGNPRGFFRPTSNSMTDCVIQNNYISFATGTPAEAAWQGFFDPAATPLVLSGVSVRDNVTAYNSASEEGRGCIAYLKGKDVTGVSFIDNHRVGNGVPICFDATTNAYGCNIKGNSSGNLQDQRFSPATGSNEITNGTLLTNDTGWTLAGDAVYDAELQAITFGTGSFQQTGLPVFTVGSYYRVDFEIVQGTEVSFRVIAGNSAVLYSTTYDREGVYTAYFKAVNAGNFIQFVAYGGHPNMVSIRNIKFRKVK